MQPQLLAAEWSPLPPAVPAAPPAATASVLLELLDDDLLLRCVALLGNPRMLLRLAVCCRRFGAVRHGGRLPIAHEAARQWVGGCSARQQEWVVRPLQDLGWLGRMHEVIQLQTPAFSQANERISLSLGGRRADYYNQHWPHGAMQGDRCAKSSAIMRAGRHFAQFSLVWATECMLGVVPPGHSVNEAGTNTFTDESHCFLKISTGKRWPDGLAQWADWEGMQTAQSGDCIGMLLDLDQGSLAVYKNGSRLGLLRTSGLSAEYCWAADLFSGECVEIATAAVPAG